MWKGRAQHQVIQQHLSEQLAATQNLLAEISRLHGVVAEMQSAQDQDDRTRLSELAKLQDTLSKVQDKQEQQRQDLKQLAEESRGVKKVVTNSDQWTKTPPEATFFDEDSAEICAPFWVPFSPEIEVMLWLAHTDYPTVPATSLILPRSYAHREFVRLDSPTSDEAPIVTIIGEDQASTLDSYLALVIGGYYAPPGWQEAIHRLKVQPDLNIWLIWYMEMRQEGSEFDNRIRVALTHKLKQPEHAPINPPEWEGKEVLFFSSKPVCELTRPLPKISVVRKSSPQYE